MMSASFLSIFTKSNSKKIFVTSVIHKGLFVNYSLESNLDLLSTVNNIKFCVMPLTSYEFLLALGSNL